jgi:hypothetical protein
MKLLHKILLGAVVILLLTWMMIGEWQMLHWILPRPRSSPVPVAAEVEVVDDSTPALAILYRGEVYTVTDIQLAPDGRTFLAQFRTQTRRTK